MDQKSIMWKYISQEEMCIEELLNDKKIATCASTMKHIYAIYLVAHGSSFNAANCVADFLSKYGGVRCYCLTPCNLLHNQHSLWQEDKAHTLVIAISQTGTSRGVLEAITNVKQQGYPTLGITDIKDSSLVRQTDEVLFMHCGEENSNAKTKGYSCTLVLLMLFAIYLGKAKGNKTVDEDLLLTELKESAQEIKTVMKQTITWCQSLQMGKDIKDLYVIGYDLHYGTALEGQLKVMETMCIPTMFNDLLELSHGMHRSIHENSTVLLIKTNHELESMMEQTYQYLKSITKNVYIIDTVVKDHDPHRLTLQPYPLTNSLLNITTAIQAISVWIPEINGLDPNRVANDTYTDLVSTRI